MKTRFHSLSTGFALLALTTLNSQFSTALAQATTNVFDVSITRTIALNVNAGSSDVKPINLMYTNFGTFSYGTSQNDSDPTYHASANGLVSQSGSVMIVSNVLYVTGSCAANGSVNSVGNSTAAANSQFSINFFIHETAGYTLQASTASAGSYFIGPPDSFTVYPTSLIDFVSHDFGDGYPASGQVTGTLVGPGEYLFDAHTQVSTEAGPPSYPSADSLGASVSYSLTVYPASIIGSGGGGNGSTNNPVLAIKYDGTNVVLSWPILYPDFLLTSTTNLTSTNWPVVPTPPSIVGNQWQVTNGAPVGDQYYRLLGQ